MASLAFTAPPSRSTTSPVIVTTDSTRSESSDRQRLAAGAAHDLGQAVMIAQIDEQHAAMVALAVDPARQADGRSDIGWREARRKCGYGRRA